MYAYFLPQHVHTCISNGCIVFLDIKNDRYFSYPHPISRILLPLSEERCLNISEFTVDFGKIGITKEHLLQELENAGLITQDVSFSQPKSLRFRHDPTSDCSDAYLTTFYSVPSRYIWNFIKAFFLSLVSIKLLSLHWTINSISNQYVFINKNQQSLSNEDLQIIMQIFRQIRVFFYTSKDHCYFDCAVLMRFLRYCGINASWVFGVQADPFEAHCWVQVNDVVMSDWLVRTTPFTPILCV